jgi:DNA-binding XRE family transcriptional regulator
MSKIAKSLFSERELAALAKKYRLPTGRIRTVAARELGVARPTVVQAEENPELPLTKLRIRIIEAYSPYKVTGPWFKLEPK